MGYDTTRFTVLKSGNEVDLKSPDPADIEMEDIMYNLSQISRYVGSRESVAQHSVYVARHLEEQGYNEETQLHGLLHDAAEAYMGDVPRPTKNLDSDFEDTYSGYEDQLLEAIYESQGLEMPDEEQETAVKQADTEVTLIEFYKLGGPDILEMKIDDFPDWNLNDAYDLLDETEWWEDANWEGDTGETSYAYFNDTYSELQHQI